MAFGIPGSDTGGGNGEFLGRLQFDARSGLWKHVTRTQDGGRYVNVESEDYMNPSFLMDFGSLEVGFAKISSPPVFLLVPFGQALPPKPNELNDEGKQAFNPAARVKVMSSKTFGDSEPRYFMLASKTGLPAIEEAWNAFSAAPEAAEGKVPLVSTSTRTLEITTPRGASKFKVPVFSITGWVDRPAALGERLINPPTVQGQRAPAATPAQAKPAAPPANHVPPPAQRQPEMAGAESDLEF